MAMMELVLSAVLGQFLITFALIQLTPGPNVLAVGAHAAVHGLRATLPMGLGVAFGIGMVAAVALWTGSRVMVSMEHERIGTALAALVLMALAAHVALKPVRSHDPAMPLKVSAAAAFAAGLATSVTSPTVIAFFLAQSMGDAIHLAHGEYFVATLAGVIAIAFLRTLVVAAVFSGARMRRFVRERGRLFAFVLAAIILALGVRLALTAAFPAGLPSPPAAKPPLAAAPAAPAPTAPARLTAPEPARLDPAPLR